MILRRSTSVVPLLFTLVTACGCQMSTESLPSGVLSKPSQLADGLASRTRAFTSRLTRQASGRRTVPDAFVGEQNYAGVQLAMGQSFEKDGNLASAEAAYEAALRNEPSLAAAHHRLALIKEKTGRDSESLAHFQSALELDSANPELQCDVGYCYYLRRNWALAEEHLRRSIDLDPRSARAHNNLGLVLARTERTEAAMQHFAQAGLTAAQVHTNLAFVHMTDERFDDARLQLSRAIAAEPKLAQARTLMASLNDVAAGPASRAASTNLSAVDSVPASVRPDLGLSDQIDEMSNSRKAFPSTSSLEPQIRLAQFGHVQEGTALPSASGALSNRARYEMDPVPVSSTAMPAGSTTASIRDTAGTRSSRQHEDAPIVFDSGFGEQH